MQSLFQFDWDTLRLTCLLLHCPRSVNVLWKENLLVKYTAVAFPSLLTRPLRVPEGTRYSVFKITTVVE